MRCVCTRCWVSTRVTTTPIDEDHPIPSRPVAGTAPPARKGWTLALAALGAFLTSLDVVVVATALPTLRSDLHASLSDLEWTINAYNLVFACLMLTGASLGDRFGRRRLYVLGLLVFTAGSAAAALSSTAGELIASRVLQGVGAAVLMPLTLTLISNAFPVEKRGAAIGIWGGVSGLGVAAGPVLGGAIVEGISWQWIFWINVPVGLVVAALSTRLLKESRGPRQQLDLPGLVMVGAALFGLTWAPVGRRSPAGAAPRSSAHSPPVWSCWPHSWPGNRAPVRRCCRSSTSSVAPSRPRTG
ncbi:MFS transporter [Kribbella sp. VKM Ac-2568]|uniref:MFS transporter n=1 Tax=Kribbella sp. VKM Ac-2568 TaxID=2512219 RepID=UPI00351A81D4